MRFSAAPDVVGGRLIVCANTSTSGSVCPVAEGTRLRLAGTGNAWRGPHLFPREQVQTSTGHGTRGALPQRFRARRRSGAGRALAHPAAEGREIGLAGVDALLPPGHARLGQGFEHAPGRPPQRPPARPGARHPDGNAGPLHRGRLEGDLVDPVVAARERHRLARPQAHEHLQPPARQPAQGDRLPGQLPGSPPGQRGHHRPQPQPLGGQGGHRADVAVVLEVGHVDGVAHASSGVARRAGPVWQEAPTPGRAGRAATMAPTWTCSRSGRSGWPIGRRRWRRGCGPGPLRSSSARATCSGRAAPSAGVKDVRSVLAAARERLGAMGRRSILFIDEIHRFNKGQQDALLPGVEDRTVVLVGATTENPFFTVNAPLMSRSLLFRLEPLGSDDLATIVGRALADPERGLGGRGLTLDDDALAHLVDRADGDARHALNALEAAALVVTAKAGDASGARITLADIEDALQRPRVTYDRAGDQHYDVASAFIKSIRGSDPDAALHYLARMLAAGEDPRFVARRLVISASEDVGLADPQALSIAVAAFQALEFVELAEARPGRVPSHLQSASYAGERKLGIGVGYVYPHDQPGHWVAQRYLPEGLRGGYYRPSDQGREAQLAEAWRRRRGQPPDPPA